MALTVQWYLPSGACAPAGSVPSQLTRYVPGARWPASSSRVLPSGATSFALTVDGRTSLYDSASRSPTRSPFGDKVGAGAGAYTPV